MPNIHPQLHQLLSDIPTNIIKEVEYANLLSTCCRKRQTYETQAPAKVLCQIQECVVTALERYPFTDKQRTLINYDLTHTFLLWAIN